MRGHPRERRKPFQRLSLTSGFLRVTRDAFAIQTSEWAIAGHSYKGLVSDDGYVYLTILSHFDEWRRFFYPAGVVDGKLMRGP